MDGEDVGVEAVTSEGPLRKKVSSLARETSPECRDTASSSSTPSSVHRKKSAEKGGSKEGKKKKHESFRVHKHKTKKKKINVGCLFEGCPQDISVRKRLDK